MADEINDIECSQIPLETSSKWTAVINKMEAIYIKVDARKWPLCAWKILAKLSSIKWDTFEGKGNFFISRPKQDWFNNPGHKVPLKVNPSAFQQQKLVQ